MQGKCEALIQALMDGERAYENGAFTELCSDEMIRGFFANLSNRPPEEDPASN